MEEQIVLDEAGARTLIDDPRFGLGKAWREPATVRALAGVAPFEETTYLGNAIRAFMSARATPAKTDRFLKLWTAVNALCGQIAVRFEAAQTVHLRCESRKLPARYRIQMIDNASIGALAALIDPAHPLPYFTTLHSQAFREAQRALGDLAQGLLRACEQNPRGAVAQLTEMPSASTLDGSHAQGAKATTATEKLFALAEELELSPLVFVMLVASYDLRNGLIHGSIPLPLLPHEQSKGLEALELCSLVLDSFLDEALPQAAQQLDAGDGHAAPFPEQRRQAIAHYLDHRFDGLGARGILRKYGLLW